MTDQSETPAVPEQVACCDTCDLFFRAHSGRQTCPTCGGGIKFILMTLDEPAEPAADDEPVSSVPQAPGTDEQDQASAPPAVEAAPSDEPPPDAPPANAFSAGEESAGGSSDAEAATDRLAKTSATDAP